MFLLIGPNGVLLEVEATWIGGTDVHMYKWTSRYEHVESVMPMPLRHEFAERNA